MTTLAIGKLALKLAQHSCQPGTLQQLNLAVSKWQPSATQTTN